MTPPASQGFESWGLMSTYGTTKTDAAEAHVNSPASWTTRGKDLPTAHLLDLVPGEGVGSFVYEVQSSITKESAQQ